MRLSVSLFLTLLFFGMCLCTGDTKAVLFQGGPTTQQTPKQGTLLDMPRHCPFKDHRGKCRNVSCNLNFIYKNNTNCVYNQQVVNFNQKRSAKL